METIRIPRDAERIISTSSKGDQSKWRIGNKWVKQNARGYEGQAEVLASLVLECSTLDCSNYVVYQPCIIQLADGEQFDGCYSLDFRGTKQEVTLERLFEANFSSTDPITSNKTLSTTEKFEQLMAQVEQFTGLNVRRQIAQLFAFDALILNEDRHTNNILFLYDPKEKTWELAPIFDNGLSLLSDEKDYAPGKPLTILKRKVKAKPLNSAFTKQLALYEGPPFIDREKLVKAIEHSPYDFGRAKDVLLSQLRDSALKHLFIEGSEMDD
ncbi:HipA domain-containing protein [Lysinibacillus sp. NPDC096418]|uniref:HipA domain-containing protein n=1 Tax=Lysinibacillus sp. NPDC096418 TaxID=3364138 RepID=UPI0037F4EA9F